MEYLQNSAEIKEKLIDLFSGMGEKWAIVAFVGKNPFDHIPKDVSNLSVVCWPKAGGTNPDGIRELIENGVSVYFSERLHTKLYWKENTGLIIGSANLSNNALGEGALSEFAVYSNDKNFDIQNVLKELHKEAVTPKALNQLEVEDRAYKIRIKDQKGYGTNVNSEPKQTFIKAMDSRYPKSWKLVTWSEERNNVEKKKVKAEVDKVHPSHSSFKDIDIESDNFQIGDFILQVKTNDNSFIDSPKFEWLLVEHIINNGDLRVAVQLRKSKDTPTPPFVIDSTFKKHLKTVFNECIESSKGFESICNKDFTVRSSFISKLIANIK